VAIESRQSAIRAFLALQSDDMFSFVAVIVSYASAFGIYLYWHNMRCVELNSERNPRNTNLIWQPWNRRIA